MLEPAAVAIAAFGSLNGPRELKLKAKLLAR